MRACCELPRGAGALALPRPLAPRPRCAAPAPTRRSSRAAPRRAPPSAAASDAQQPPAVPPPCAPGARLSRRSLSAALSLAPFFAPLLARAVDAGDDGADEAAAAAAMAAVIAKQPAIGGFQRLSVDVGGRALSFEARCHCFSALQSVSAAYRPARPAWAAPLRRRLRAAAARRVGCGASCHVATPHSALTRPLCCAGARRLEGGAAARDRRAGRLRRGVIRAAD